MDEETGLCPAHEPGARERLSALGRLGAEVTRRKWERGRGIEPDELPDLVTHKDAIDWIQTVGRAVASGRITHNQGSTMVRVIEAWLKATDSITKPQVEELRHQIAELKKGPLRVVR